MVTDAGKTLRPHTLKPVNVPEEVQVEESPAGLPLALRDRRRQAIEVIHERWRIDDEWWRDTPVARLYFAVTLSSGQRLVIFKDLHASHWYRQSY